MGLKERMREISPHVKNFDLEFIKNLKVVFPDMKPKEAKRMMVVLTEMMGHPNTVPADMAALKRKREANIVSLMGKSKKMSEETNRLRRMLQIFQETMKRYEEEIRAENQNIKETDEMVGEFGIKG